MKEKETIIDKLGRIITKIASAVAMNFMFLVACIPVVTIGAAFSALYSAVRFQIRKESWWHGFKFGFRNRFMRSTIAWLVMGAIDTLMFVDVLQYVNAYMDGACSVVYPIASCLMFAMMAMMTFALLILNVYIPTAVGTWIKNAASMVFKSPAQLLLSTALVWCPVFLFFFRFDLLFYGAMVVVVAYFTCVAFMSTVLMKDTLIDFLLDARIEGTLLAEEGRVIVKDEECDEEK